MDKTIIRSIWIAAPRERVWQAVTDPAQLQQWFAPGTPMSKNGDTISVRIGDTDVAVAVIEVFDPPRQITTHSLPERKVATTYLLEEENGGTRFTVTETGLETIPAEERQQHIERNGRGWENALENLKAHIEGKPLPHPAGF